VTGRGRGGSEEGKGAGRENVEVEGAGSERRG